MSCLEHVFYFTRNKKTLAFHKTVQRLKIRCLNTCFRDPTLQSTHRISNNATYMWVYTSLLQVCIKDLHSMCVSSAAAMQCTSQLCTDGRRYGLTCLKITTTTPPPPRPHHYQKRRKNAKKDLRTSSAVVQHRFNLCARVARSRR